MVVPALATLLSDASWEIRRYSRPILRSLQQDYLSEDLIFFFGPGSVRHMAPVTQLKVAFVALDF